MEVIFVLIPVSLFIIVAAIWAFVWSVRHDQFEDLEKEGHRILFEDQPARQEKERRTPS